MTRHRQGFILWLMGPTSSGKSTIALAALEALRDKGMTVLHVDGDEVRNLLGPELGFSPQARNQVVNIITFVARKAAEAGTNVIVSALTASEEARRQVQDECPNLVVGHIDCPIEECINRDPKGLYKKAIDGEIDTLIGYNTTYLPPKSPDITIQTAGRSVEECVRDLIAHLEITMGNINDD